MRSAGTPLNVLPWHALNSRPRGGGDGSFLRLARLLLKAAYGVAALAALYVVVGLACAVFFVARDESIPASLAQCETDGVPAAVSVTDQKAVSEPCYSATEAVTRR